MAKLWYIERPTEHRGRIKNKGYFQVVATSDKDLDKKEYFRISPDPPYRYVFYPTTNLIFKNLRDLTVFSIFWRLIYGRVLNFTIKKRGITDKQQKIRLGNLLYFFFDEPEPGAFDSLAVNMNENPTKTRLFFYGATYHMIEWNILCGRRKIGLFGDPSWASQVALAGDIKIEDLIITVSLKLDKKEYFPLKDIPHKDFAQEYCKMVEEKRKEKSSFNLTRYKVSKFEIASRNQCLEPSDAEIKERLAKWEWQNSYARMIVEQAIKFGSFRKFITTVAKNEGIPLSKVPVMEEDKKKEYPKTSTQLLIDFIKTAGRKTPKSERSKKEILTDLACIYEIADIVHLELARAGIFIRQ